MMIAKLSSGGQPVAALDSGGDWHAAEGEFAAAVVKNLDILFDPNDPLTQRTGDHHTGYGRAAAARAAAMFGLDVEFNPPTLDSADYFTSDPTPQSETETDPL